MKRSAVFAAVFAVLVVLQSVSMAIVTKENELKETTTNVSYMVPSQNPASNLNADAGPFAEDSPLPYHMPPFDKIKDSDYRPAFEAGMALQRKEVDAIAHNPAPPSFENTIVALERSGRVLTRVDTVFSQMTSTNTNDELDKIQTEMAPKLSRHQDAISLDPALFARINDLYGRRTSLGLDPESLRLLERDHTLFVRAGAALSEADKDKLRKFNEQLSTLQTKFQQTLLKATNDGAAVVDNLTDLDGLSSELIAAAAEAAKARKLAGKWVITLQNTTGQEVLAQLKNRALRERIYKASISRADGGPDDNTATVAQIIRLRAERAALLGYPTHAAYVLEDETAGTPDAVNRMLAQLAPPGRSQCEQGSGGHAEADRRAGGSESHQAVQARALGLGVLCRAGPQGAL